MSLLTSASQKFEDSLLDAYRTTAPSNDEAYLRCMIVVDLASGAMSTDESIRQNCLAALRLMHRAYNYVCIYDNNWSDQPKRVFAFKPEYLSDELKGVYGQLLPWWPYMPMASKIFDTIRSRNLTAQVLGARIAEYTLIAMCTKPTVMSPHINLLARATLQSMSVQFPSLSDPHAAADIADRITDSFDRRPMPVSRFKARSSTIKQAVKNTTAYVTAAIKTRAQEYIQTEINYGASPPASSIRRWKRMKLDLTNIDAIRAEMKRRQTGVKDGMVSVKTIADAMGISRKVVDKAIRTAQMKHGFIVERGRQRIAQITPQQAVWIIDCIYADKDLKDSMVLI